MFVNLKNMNSIAIALQFDRVLNFFIFTRYKQFILTISLNYFKEILNIVT